MDFLSIKDKRCRLSCQNEEVASERVALNALA